MTRENANELVTKNRNHILGRAAFEGELDTISTFYAIGKASYDELTAILVQASVLGYKTIEESFEIYDRGALVSHEFVRTFLEEAKENNEKINAEAHKLFKTADKVKEEVIVILDEASILSRKSADEMRTLYDICQTTTNSETKALFVATAAMSRKTMDEVQAVVLSTKSLMKKT